MKKINMLIMVILVSINIAQEFDTLTHEERVALLQIHQSELQEKLQTLQQLYNDNSDRYNITFEVDSLGNVTQFNFGGSVPLHVQEFFNNNIDKFSPGYFSPMLERYGNNWELYHQDHQFIIDYQTNRTVKE